jgi:predicted fused transcriptional regulator/phosphomethylpyrimidine kinase
MNKRNVIKLVLFGSVGAVLAEEESAVEKFIKIYNKDETGKYNIPEIVENITFFLPNDECLNKVEDLEKVTGILCEKYREQFKLHFGKDFPNVKNVKLQTIKFIKGKKGQSAFFLDSHEDFTGVY